MCSEAGGVRVLEKHAAMSWAPNPTGFPAQDSIAFLDGDFVAAALGWPDLRAALSEAFVNGCTAPVRVRHEISVPGTLDASLLFMPAWIEGDVGGVKLVNVFPGNARHGRSAISATYTLFSAETGAVLCLMDGEELTIRRTAAASALAADFLVRRDASALLVVGTGGLAPVLAEAHMARHRYDRVLVWGRRSEAAEATAARLIAKGLPAEAVSDLAGAVQMADVITVATLSKDPLILGDWLKPGTHLDLVGAFRPDMRETDDRAVARSKVFVDTRAGALAEAGDLIQAISSGAFSPSKVTADLADLCRGTHAGRASDEEITLFKSVGAAIEDLAAARLVYRTKQMAQV
jgi:ornithine cyclodeaminase/alanine dehydrogenase-like protein (mu-crystallin family)